MIWFKEASVVTVTQAVPLDTEYLEITIPVPAGASARDRDLLVAGVAIVNPWFAAEINTTTQYPILGTTHPLYEPPDCFTVPTAWRANPAVARESYQTHWTGRVEGAPSSWYNQAFDFFVYWRGKRAVDPEPASYTWRVHFQMVLARTGWGDYPVKAGQDWPVTLIGWMAVLSDVFTDLWLPSQTSNPLMAGNWTDKSKGTGELSGGNWYHYARSNMKVPDFGGPGYWNAYGQAWRPGDKTYHVALARSAVVWTPPTGMTVRYPSPEGETSRIAFIEEDLNGSYDENRTFQMSGSVFAVSVGGWLVQAPHNIIRTLQLPLHGSRLQAKTAGNSYAEYSATPPRQINELWRYRHSDAVEADGWPQPAAGVDTKHVDGPVQSVSLTRMPDGSVGISYMQWRTVKAAVSRDGGRSFGVATTVATGYDQHADGFSAADGLWVFALFKITDYTRLRGTWYVSVGTLGDDGTTWSFSTPVAMVTDAKPGPASLHRRSDGVWEFGYTRINPLQTWEFNVEQKVVTCRALAVDGTGTWS